MNNASARPGDLLKQAFALHRNQKMKPAIEIYNRLIAQDRNNFDALQLLGLCHYQIGQPDAALEYLNRALSIRQTVASVFNHRGIVLRALGRNAEALEDFDKAIRLDPSRSDYHYNKSNSLRDQKRLEEARQCLVKALELTPGNFEYLNNLAGVLVESQLNEEALSCFNELVKRYPSNADAQANRGLLLHRLKRLDEALQCQDRAISINPAFAEAHNYRGNVLVELKRRDEALVSFDRAIWLLPDYAVAFRNRGHVLMQMNRLDEALACFDKATALKADYAEAHVDRGNALRKLNRLDEALASLDHAIGLSGDSAEAFARRGDVLRDMKRLGDAHESFDKAIQLDPELAKAYSGRARVFADQEHWDKSREDYEAALRLEPAQRTALRGLSMLPPGSLSAERAADLLAIAETADFSSEPAGGMFTRANLLEHLNRVQESFACIRQANVLRRTDTSNAPEEHPDQFSKLISEVEAWTPSAGHPDGRAKTLLMILGPSRSGKTSLERLLCQDTRIYRGFEAGAANLAIKKLAQLETEGRAAEALQRDVLQALFPFSFPEFIEKDYEAVTITNPFLLAAVPRISDLYGNAFFVFVERDAVDNAAEIYKKDYKSRYAFAYSADAALAHVNGYSEVSRALQAKMGGRSIRIGYDELLTSPRSVLLSVYDLIGMSPQAEVVDTIRQEEKRDVRSAYREIFEGLLEQAGAA
jgi:tetratricopeptide (TPR) repeat protein